MIRMNKNLVSIVVPVYNAAEHIERCVESVIDQSYDNWELILVNDGSTDDSLVVCYALQQRDKRITVVDKTNGGASSARNVGIKKLEEVYDMGYEDYFYNGGLCLIEWPELIEQLLPEDAVKVSISEQPDGSRLIEF